MGPDGVEIMTLLKTEELGIRIRFGDYTGELTEEHGRLVDNAVNALMACVTDCGYPFTKEDIGYFSIKLEEPHGPDDLIYLNNEEVGESYHRGSKTARVPGNFLPETTNKGRNNMQPVIHGTLHHLFFKIYDKNGSEEGKWIEINGRMQWVDHQEPYWACTWVEGNSYLSP